MITENIDMALVRQGITRAALDHDAEITRLQAELNTAYKQIEASLAVADMKNLREQLHEARTELELNRKKLAETERKLAALSQSRLGAFQLRYWRWRNGKRTA